MSATSLSSAPSTDAIRPPLMTKRTGDANFLYFSVNQSPISSAASTPSTDCGQVNVSPSGRLPQCPCSQYRPSLGIHLIEGEKLATSSVPSDLCTEVLRGR